VDAKNALAFGDVASDEVDLQRQLGIDADCSCRVNRHPAHDTFKYNAIGVSRSLRWAQFRDRSSKPFIRFIAWRIRLP
jgi:hypothetical protein